MALYSLVRVISVTESIVSIYAAAHTNIFGTVSIIAEGISQT